ncbi:NAD-dependent epimerase/dehydratase family protein, partial [Actinacidiphila bryophytorum]
MRIAVTGASGLIGGALTTALAGDGHEVVRLVRRETAAPDEVQWDPKARALDPGKLKGCGAVVHLA